MRACLLGPLVAPHDGAMAWHDEGFAYAPSLVSVNNDDLLRLEPELVKILADPSSRCVSASKRLDRLFAMLYGREIGFDFDRRNQIDFLSLCGSALFVRAGPLELTSGAMQARDMIVDFEPEFGSRRIGESLNDQSILARFKVYLIALNLSIAWQVECWR